MREQGSKVAQIICTNGHLHQAWAMVHTMKQASKAFLNEANEVSHVPR